MKVNRLIGACCCIFVFFIITSMDIGAQTYPPWENDWGIPIEKCAEKYIVDNVYQGVYVWGVYKYAIDNFTSNFKATKYFQSPSVLDSTKNGDCKALAMWFFEEMLDKAPHSDPVLVFGKVVKNGGRTQYYHTWVSVRSKTQGVRIIIDLFKDDYVRSLVMPETGIYSEYQRLFRIRDLEDVKVILHTADVLSSYYGIRPVDAKLGR